MGKKTITFTMTPSDLMGYWIKVGSEPLQVNNNIVDLDLESGREHGLAWWMEGNDYGKGKLTIVGTDRATKNEEKKVLVSVTSSVRPGRLSAIGGRIFVLEK